MRGWCVSCHGDPEMCRPFPYSSRLCVVLVTLSCRESDRRRSPVTSGICIDLYRPGHYWYAVGWNGSLLAPPSVTGWPVMVTMYPFQFTGWPVRVTMQCIV